MTKKYDKNKRAMMALNHSSEPKIKTASFATMWIFPVSKARVHESEIYTTFYAATETQVSKRFSHKATNSIKLCQNNHITN